MEHEFIKLEHIDTTVAAKNFSELLNDNKTYFLNGSWGSGKSEFLKEVKRGSQNKLITIDFWRLSDTRSTIEIAFSKLHPLLYWTIRLGIIVLVAVFILMTSVVDIGLSNYFGGLKPLILELGGVVALIVAVWQVFKKKSDEFYCFLLSKLPKFSKVLIIDDFDRMSEKQQEESYKLFSLINGKLPIVFVGDITKVHKNDDNYLSKIIDRQVELPFDLHPSKIWNNYFSVLEDKFNIVLSKDFKERISSDQKNLRDREHFNDYVNQEFFTRGRLDHVQVEQQLLVIYAYLFYPDLYMNLLKDEAIRVEESEESGFLDIIRIGHTIKEQLSEIQSSDNSDYPLSFKKNKLEYLLYEQTSNRTKIELDLLFTSNSENLISEIIESDQSSDFYQYLSSQFRTFSKIMKEQLLIMVIKESIKFKNSPSMNFIVQESLNEVIPSYERDSPLTEDVIIRIIKMWESILRNENLDQSEIIYFLNKHDLLSFHELGLYYSDLRIDTETFSNLRRKDFFLLTYLSSKRLFEKFELWDNTIWEAIKLFDDREFLSFWIFQFIITNELDYEGFDIIPEDKRYTIWTGRYLFESPHKHTDYKESVISKIKPRLEKMEKEGFTFTKMEDTIFKVET
ncbi:MAG: P-loop NTPase fold protein [Streptococcus thermophilus]|uniref:P-loop NTPase fold protein n=2 Tax=Streptococcus thermophilus TaxID=1308 RepID=UPI000C220BE1|nr:P-loop NTPase fold protein [Streptococcus thermophilus]MBW7802748.1 KAP family NTPase [Streptococcus thermophilus]MBW7825644.1 KAP family NTPase [Streptococcus thermophilus]MCZ0707783.1 P-loop NTPase fold protein [Streptococcus thermophilus]MDA5412445.1 P-loop NTPase fold protein [Streptococcus thermophilus]PJH80256.1 NTPase [Streptococcus thermophilus]